MGGAAAPANLVGVAWRDWDGDGDMETAGLFQLSADPGELKNGNSLCSGSAQWVVVWQEISEFSRAYLAMAVYSHGMPPSDGKSTGLCGTFNYSGGQ